MAEMISSIQTTHPRAYQDWLINARERLINGLLGVQHTQVLNTGPATERQDAGAGLAAEFTRVAKALKSMAIGPDGKRVDYAFLRASDAYQELRQMCTPRLRRFDPSALSDRDEKLAFWINLYNVLIINAVIDFGVQTSVTEGRLGLLTFFRRAAFDIQGQRLSAEDIEHGLLRGNAGHPYLPGPQFGPHDPRSSWIVRPADVRIHFALNCASRSCPPIGVYEGARLDAQLDFAARSFIHQDVQVESTRNEVRVSSIFKWYGADFGGQNGTLAFILDHLPAGDDRAVWLRDHAESVRLAFKPYDWSLNT